MRIDTYRVKQYNSTLKTVVCVDGKPICIVKGRGKTLSNIISYLQGYDVEITDGKIKKILDKYRIEKDDKIKLSWLGKNCKDCGNEKCKSLGKLQKGYDCALWQEKESEEKK